MMPKKQDLREKLKLYQFEFDILQKIPCSYQENEKYRALLKSGQPLPDDVFKETSDLSDELTNFYTIYQCDLSPEEISEYLTYKKLNLLNTIKKCAVFFTALTIVSLILSILF